jgi:hypothetical protein
MREPTEARERMADERSSESNGAGIGGVGIPQRAARAKAPRAEASRDWEAELSDLFEDYVERGRPGLRFLIAHPLRSLRTRRAVAHMPRVGGELGDGVEGRAIRQVLRPRGMARLLAGAKCVLLVPEDPAAYSLGASRQTLRRKVRVALAQGITWAPVDGPEARRGLVELADAHEREHPLEEYRRSDPSNDDLYDYALWLVALAADGRPLLLSVTAADGDWATLRYFRVLGEGPEYTVSRYLMTQVLVEHLSRNGVRYLVDTQSPWNLANGLRHFQRMLGWRIVVPVTTRGRGSARAPAAPHP